MPPEGRLTPEDLARELVAPIEWVEEARWALQLPHHVLVRDGSWFVDPADVHIWAAAVRILHRLTGSSAPDEICGAL